MEANFPCVDASDAPSIKKDGCNRNRVKHGFSAKAPFALDSPHGIHADSLRKITDHEKIGQGYAIVGHHLILQCQNDSNGGIQSVSEQKVALGRC